MRLETFGLTAVGFSVALCSIALAGQTGPDGVEAHVKAAQTAAGQEHNAMFHRLCDPPAARGRSRQPLGDGHQVGLRPLHCLGPCPIALPGTTSR